MSRKPDMPSFKKKTFSQIVSAMTPIILQQILTISKPLNHGITLFSQHELPFSQLEYKLHSNSEPGNKQH
jgi:hypothetical protein